MIRESLWAGNHLNENGWRGQDEGPGPYEGQNALGLSDGADGLGLQGVDDGVAPERFKSIESL